MKVKLNPVKHPFRLVCMVLAVLLPPLGANAQGRASRPAFNPATDILIAQFDGKPDADDVQALAALGCMLAHPDLKGVKAYGVLHAFGTQKSNVVWHPDALMNRIFGADGWTSALREKEVDRWEEAIGKITAQVTPVLKAGGRVWVQEAGQSDLTMGWIGRVIRDDNGLTAADTRARVHVVQHSTWNENHAAKDALAFVKNHADYIKIDDGNQGGKGNQTPKYVSPDPSLLTRAMAKENPNRAAAELWSMAHQVIGSWSEKYSVIGKGGVDFSDCVENGWIFQTADRADTVEKFWERYVVNRDGPPRP